jgi:ubiquinone/menaquinone biosynthesis C-methylase UbiE
MSHVTYYDGIAKGYDRLHKQEQQRKLKVILPHLQIKPTDMFVDVGCGTGVAFPFFNVRRQVLDLPGSIRRE